jgi:hypothetical protein
MVAGMLADGRLTVRGLLMMWNWHCPNRNIGATKNNPDKLENRSGDARRKMRMTASMPGDDHCEWETGVLTLAILIWGDQRSFLVIDMK